MFTNNTEFLDRISGITCMECKDAADCYRCFVVCNVCLSDVTMSCANMAEPIKMPFVMLTSGGPKEPCIRRGVWIPHGKVQFFFWGGENGHPHTMQPFIKVLWSLVVLSVILPNVPTFLSHTSSTFLSHAPSTHQATLSRTNSFVITTG